MKKFLLTFIKAALCSGLLFSAALAHAENVTGQAYVENGNIDKARQEARNDAMRSFVESRIGVNVRAESEMVDFLVVRDHVVSKSDGYVAVKRVVSESLQNDILTIVLDLEAGNKPIVVGDIKGLLQSVSDDSSRSGLDIAIVADDLRSSNKWSSYLAGSLASQGFRANRNDAVLMFLSKNQGLNDFELNTRIRQIGRSERLDANSIVRGRVELLRRGELAAPGAYRAVASLTCEIIGYESNTVDSVSYTAAAIAETPQEAETKAYEKAISEGAAILAQHASATVQQETRGGMMNVKTVLTFSGLNSPADERVIILDALGNAECRVVRSAFENGSLRVFVTSSSYANQGEMVNAVLELLRPVYPSIINEEDASAGSLKYIIKLRG